jgi:hypothetical protein
MLPCTRLMADGSVQFRAGCWIIFFLNLFFPPNCLNLKLKLTEFGKSNTTDDALIPGGQLGKRLLKSLKFQV